MPVIFRDKGYKYLFYSNEGNPQEPCHVHVRKHEAIAKFWIFPEVRLDNAYGISPEELNKIEDVVRKKKKFIEECWNEYFSKSTTG